MPTSKWIAPIALLSAITSLCPVSRSEPTFPEKPGTETRRPQPGRGDGAGGRGEMLLQRFRDATAELNLSDEQKSKIEEIIAKSKDDVRDLLVKIRDLRPEKRQQKFLAVLTDLREKVTAVLTEDQAKMLKEKLANIRGPGRPGGPGGRPGAGDAPAGESGQPLRIQATLSKLQDALATLELSPEQKTQVKSIVDDGKKQLEELRQKMQSGAIKPEEMRQQAPAVFAAMRDQLSGILSPPQQDKLREAMQNAERAKAREKPSGEKASGTGETPMKMSDPEKPADAEKMSEEKKTSDEKSSADAKARRESPSAANSPQSEFLSPHTGPAIGSPAPQFTVEKLDGRNASLSMFRNKPLVIEFGSYSSPSFRQRAAKMEELAKQYSTKANFLVIYTKEAHPTGGWEVDRNTDDGVRVKQHADLNARKSAAKDARQALKLTRPLAVDKMNDEVAKAFGAGENSAVVIGRDGTIVAKQTWADPFRLRAALDQAIAAKSTTQPTD